MVFHCRAYGLANRLRALVGYYALSRCRGVPFYVRWVPTPECAARFEELFEKSPFVLLTASAFAAQRRKGAMVCEDMPWFDRIWEDAADPSIRWPVFVREVRRGFDALRPTRGLRREVAAFAEKFELSTRIGLHIRHTDNLALFARLKRSGAARFDPRHVSRLAGFEAVIAAAPRQGFFCATDNREVEARLLAKHRSRLVCLPKTYRRPRSSAGRTSSVADALVELLLLARCRRIVGTYYSSFSKLAAIWWDRPYREVQGAACCSRPWVDRMCRALRQPG